jgi:hypothetical protein
VRKARNVLLGRLGFGGRGAKIEEGFQDAVLGFVDRGRDANSSARKN